MTPERKALIEGVVQAAIDAGLAANGEQGVAAARHAARYVAEALSAPQVEAEAVAWRYLHEDEWRVEGDFVHAEELRDRGYTVEPLFASPPASVTPPGWPDPLESPQAEAIRNGKLDDTEIRNLFDTMERELILHRERAANTAPAFVTEAVVKPLDDDQIMEIIKEVAPWKVDPEFNDLLTYEKSPPLFPQAAYDVPSYRAVNFVRAVERRVLSALASPPASVTETAQFLPTEDGEFNGNLLSDRQSYTLSFEDGLLTVKYDGSGEIAFTDQSLKWGEGEDENWRSQKLDASEIAAIRDWLNRVAPAPVDGAVEALRRLADPKAFTKPRILSSPEFKDEARKEVEARIEFARAALRSTGQSEARMRPTYAGTSSEVLTTLAGEYRPSMDKEALHSWAGDVVAAVSAFGPATGQSGVTEELWALCYLHDWDPPKEGQEHRWEPGKNVFPQVHAFYHSWQVAEAIRRTMKQPERYWVLRARPESEARLTAAIGTPSADYFGSLVERARRAAAKASVKFPQPNYVTLKIAEEAGEVVRGAVHYAEKRMEWSELEGEIVQLLAMLIRFVTEGDQVNGVVPPLPSTPEGGE